jgi:hypothetical protein
MSVVAVAASGALDVLDRGVRGLDTALATRVSMKVYGWGFGDTEPVNDLPPAPPGEPLRGVGSGRCADVPGFSTTNGTQLDLWDCNGGGNQSWNVEGNELRIYGTKCMTVGGSGGAAGDPVVITDCTGATLQQWTANANQSITSVANPALCLNAAGTGNGSPVNVATCNGDSNQAWTRS